MIMFETPDVANSAPLLKTIRKNLEKGKIDFADTDLDPAVRSDTITPTEIIDVLRELKENYLVSNPKQLLLDSMIRKVENSEQFRVLQATACTEQDDSDDQEDEYSPFTQNNEAASECYSAHQDEVELFGGTPSLEE
jgi:hypothetical protein